jgi:hypothetical protein
LQENESHERHRNDDLNDLQRYNQFSSPHLKCEQIIPCSG